MRKFRTWGQTNTGFCAKHQPIVGDRAENVTLTRRKRFCRTHGRVKEPKAAIRKSDDTGCLELRAIECTRPLQPRARLLPPVMCYAHRFHLHQKFIPTFDTIVALLIGSGTNVTQYTDNELS